MENTPSGTREVSSTAFELLFIEMVNHFLRGPGACSYLPPASAAAAASKSSSAAGAASDAPEMKLPLGPDDAVAASAESRARLESLGFDVGQRLVEFITLYTPHPDSELDMIKFVCKEVWETLFRKQIDELKTNGNGLYLLQDLDFKLLKNASESADNDDIGKEDLLLFPSGIISGVLSRLGMRCTVYVEAVRIGDTVAPFNVRVEEG